MNSIKSIEYVLRQHAVKPMCEVLNFDPSQPRDAHGRWGSGFAGSGTSRETWDALPSHTKEELEAHQFNLDRNEKKVVEEYQQENLYQPMNDYLRKGDLGSTEEYVDDFVDLGSLGLDTPEDWVNQKVAVLDSALNKNTLESDVIVFRGVSSKTFNKMEEGQIFLDRGFPSTSLDRGRAEWFQPDEGGLMRINVKRGSPALYADSVTDLGEKELILPRNSKFKIVAVRDDATSGRRIVDAELQQ